ncbi:MAG: divergent PAP2 family protein [Candidatus Omnitrophica bacterium]|nr:divergent PAP2 family protein [Candidatus Omnitrophota bacterium]
MFPALIEFGNNYVFHSVALAWLFAQTLKVLLGVIREKRFNFMWFVGTGGMPSSHGAGVTALASSAGLYAGFNTPLFALALIFAIVVLFDAQGVRRASGKQAQILNKILDDIYWQKKIQEDRLMELLGHTPIEVLTGVAIGVFMSLLCYRA